MRFCPCSHVLSVHHSCQVLALEQLHKRRIIHRDVKPANVLITRDNNLVLSDFGFSRAYALTASQQPWRLREEWAPRPIRPSPKSEIAKHPDVTRRDCGTIGYMAPEVCRGDWYTYSSDIFSLGVVFFELMNGKVRGWPCLYRMYVVTRHPVSCRLVLRTALAINELYTNK